jgi:hypothetical protein
MLIHDMLHVPMHLLSEETRHSIAKWAVLLEKGMRGEKFAEHARLNG